MPRPHRPSASRVAVVASLVAVATVPFAPASAGAAPVWVRPVPGALIRPFVAPATPYGPGHRGIDLRVRPGEPVRAPVGGVVETAGPAGGALHVVLRPADGSRVGLSFLAAVAVVPGERVAAGRVVGRAGGSGVGHPPGALHLSWRVAGVYRDPARRLAPRSYRLVDPTPGPTGSPAGGLG